jgi:hypothetical protein
MFEPTHNGLIFTNWHIQRARTAKKQPPLPDAWEQLQTLAGENRLEEVFQYCWRYRFNAAMTIGEQAAVMLDSLLTPADDDQPYLDAVRETVVLAQCFEMLRDHPALAEGRQARFLDAFWERMAALNQRLYEPRLIETLWQAVLNVAGGILLAREPVFMEGVRGFRHVIDERVHPEGYLPDAVEGEAVEGESAALHNQLMSVQALVLIAEMATHAGVDLWSHQRRGVSVLTAVTYPLYYYFYPEKWPWNGEQWKPSDGIELEPGQAIFKQHAGFLEIVHPRYERPLKAIRLMLDDLRPIYDFHGGGFVTLSHAEPKKRRRGLFG